MDELIQTVSAKAGITEEQAKLAVDAALEYVKGKLPPGLASQVDGLLAGGTMPDLSGLAGLAGLGSLFGRK